MAEKIVQNPFNSPSDSSYDEQRELSMADEGGAAGALMEAEETRPEQESSVPTSQSNIREIMLVLGIFALVGYYALREMKRPKPRHLRIVQ